MLKEDLYKLIYKMIKTITINQNNNIYDYSNFDNSNNILIEDKLKDKFVEECQKKIEEYESLIFPIKHSDLTNNRE
jgi:isocitrate dehydrogenase